MIRIASLLFIFLASLSIEAAYMKVVNVKTSLNIRIEGSSESPIVGKVGNGELVEFISEGDPELESTTGEKWYQIRYSGLQGWVKSNYVEFTDEVPQEANSGNNKLSLSWSNLYNLLPENDYLRLAVYIILGILGFIILGLLAIFALWLFGIFQYVLGCGVLVGIIGFIITKNAEGAFSFGTVGLGIGLLFGLYKSFKDPGDTIFTGLNALRSFESDSSSFSSSSSSSYSSTSSSEDEYDTIIKGGGTLGDDIEAKTTWDGKLKDKNDKTWKKHSDGTVERID